MFIQYNFRGKVQRTLTILSLMEVLKRIFSAVAIFYFETAPDCNINTAKRTLWWNYSTFATVCYGDN